MSENDTRGAVPELPDDIQRRIRDEVESGLAEFRAEDFEGKLKSALRSGLHEAGRPLASPLLRWAPAFALALTAAVIGVAVLWFNRAPVPENSTWAAALAKLPGIQNLNRTPLDLSPSAGALSTAVSPFLQPLASAAAAALALEPALPAAPILVPRYSLEQKLEILIKEQPIERALALIKSKSGEV